MLVATVENFWAISYLDPSMPTGVRHGTTGGKDMEARVRGLVCTRYLLDRWTQDGHSNDVDTIPLARTYDERRAEKVKKEKIDRFLVVPNHT
jgi:hypothetical protein